MHVSSGDEAGFRAAFFSDTHIDDHPTEQDLNLALVFDDLIRERPDAILHGGDLTEYGSQHVLDRYRQLIPDALRTRVHHVAGNHESRWDPAGLRSYADTFGSGPRSLDVNGVHIVLLEAAVVLQEQAYLGAEQLRWLDADLSATGPGTPVVVVAHFPMGQDFYYVNDADSFWDTIAPHRVDVLLTGHLHREVCAVVNGVTCVTSLANKVVPGYYWLQRGVQGGRDVLTISRVDLQHRHPASTAPQRRERGLTRVDLGASRTAADTAVAAEVSAGHGQLHVHGRAAAGDDVEVSARVWPEGTYATIDDDPWDSLTSHEGQFAGQVETADLPPGQHRLRIRRATPAQDWETTRRFEIPGGPVAPLSTLRLNGPVQGPLVMAGDTVIATTVRGGVYALELEHGTLSQRWRVGTAPVHRAPGVSADGSAIHVPTTSGRLHTLASESGEQQWEADLGHPVMSHPLVDEGRGGERIYVTAGPTTWCLDPDGATVWTAPVPPPSCGCACLVDGALILGAGDGTVRALDARTGESRWTANLAADPYPYRQLIYGPWNTSVTPIGPGTVAATTVRGITALDVHSGRQRWTHEGMYLYTPLLAVDGRVLAISQSGRVEVIDAQTGTSRTLGRLAPISLDAGPVRRGDRLFHLAFSGLLSTLDLETGHIDPLRQVTTARVLASPVLAGDTLLVGDQDGVVHALGIDQA